MFILRKWVAEPCIGLALAADVEIVLNVPRIQSKVSLETDLLEGFCILMYMNTMVSV